MQLKSKTLPYKNFLPTGQFIQAQLYQICIRQEEGSCSIAYTTRQVDSSVDAFDMHGSAAKVIFNFNSQNTFIIRDVHFEFLPFKLLWVQAPDRIFFSEICS